MAVSRPTTFYSHNMAETPDSLRVSLKVNADTNFNQDNNSIYKLDEISLLYKKSPSEPEKSRFQQQKGASLMPNHTAKQRTNNRTSQDILMQMDQLTNPTDVWLPSSQQGFVTAANDYEGISNSRINTYTDRKGNNNNKTISNYDVNESISREMSSTATKKKLLKQLHNQLEIVKGCRDMLENSIGGNSRKDIERKYFNAVELVAALQAKLKALGYENLFMEVRDHVLGKSQLGVASLKQGSRNNSNMDSIENVSIIETCNINFFSDEGRESYRSFPPSERKTKSRKPNTQETNYQPLSQGKLSFKHISDMQDTATRLYNPPHSSTHSSSKHPFIVDKQIFSHNRIKRKVSESHSSTTSMGNDLSPTANSVKHGSHKDMLLAAAVKLRKEYFHLRKVVKDSRQKLESFIKDDQKRRNIEQQYFTAQVRIENIRTEIEQLARQLKINPKKLMDVLDVSQNDSIFFNAGENSSLTEKHSLFDEFSRKSFGHDDSSFDLSMERSHKTSKFDRNENEYTLNAKEIRGINSLKNALSKKEESYLSEIDYPDGNKESNIINHSSKMQQAFKHRRKSINSNDTDEFVANKHEFKHPDDILDIEHFKSRVIGKTMQTDLNNNGTNLDQFYGEDTALKKDNSDTEEMSRDWRNVRDKVDNSNMQQDKENSTQIKKGPCQIENESLAILRQKRIAYFGKPLVPKQEKFSREADLIQDSVSMNFYLENEENCAKKSKYSGAAPNEMFDNSVHRLKLPLKPKNPSSESDDNSCFSQDRFLYDVKDFVSHNSIDSFENQSSRRPSNDSFRAASDSTIDALVKGQELYGSEEEESITDFKLFGVSDVNKQMKDEVFQGLAKENKDKVPNLASSTFSSNQAENERKLDYTIVRPFLDSYAREQLQQPKHSLISNAGSGDKELYEINEINNGYSSILDIDYENMFPNSNTTSKNTSRNVVEQVDTVESLDAFRMNLDSKTNEKKLDSDNEGSNDLDRAPSNVQDEILSPTIHGVASATDLSLIPVVEAEVIAAETLNDQCEIAGFEKLIELEEMPACQANSPVDNMGESNNIKETMTNGIEQDAELGDDDGETKPPFPSLSDVMQHISIDENSEQHLDFLLNDQMCVEEEDFYSKESSPSVIKDDDGIFNEDGIALSLQQSLDLLEELEKYENHLSSADETIHTAKSDDTDVEGEDDSLLENDKETEHTTKVYEANMLMSHRFDESQIDKENAQILLYSQEASDEDSEGLLHHMLHLSSNSTESTTQRAKTPEKHLEITEQLLEDIQHRCSTDENSLEKISGMNSVQDYEYVAQSVETRMKDFDTIKNREGFEATPHISDLSSQVPDFHSKLVTQMKRPESENESYLDDGNVSNGKSTSLNMETISPLEPPTSEELEWRDVSTTEDNLGMETTQSETTSLALEIHVSKGEGNDRDENKNFESENALPQSEVYSVATSARVGDREMTNLPQELETSQELYKSENHLSIENINDPNNNEDIDDLNKISGGNLGKTALDKLIDASSKNDEKSDSSFCSILLSPLEKGRKSEIFSDFLYDEKKAAKEQIFPAEDIVKKLQDSEEDSTSGMIESDADDVTISLELEESIFIEGALKHGNESKEEPESQTDACRTNDDVATFEISEDNDHSFMSEAHVGISIRNADQLVESQTANFSRNVDSGEICLPHSNVDDLEPVGIVNEAVVGDLEHGKIELANEHQVRPASDLRSEYEARLDLLSLPADLCDNLPLKLPSLSSTSSVDNLFAEYQENVADISDVQSEKNDSSASTVSSDSECEIQFGPGFRSDEGSSAVRSESNSERNEITDRVPEDLEDQTGDMARKSNLDDDELHMIEEYVISETEEQSGKNYENQWFNNIIVENKSTTEKAGTLNLDERDDLDESYEHSNDQCILEIGNSQNIVESMVQGNDYGILAPNVLEEVSSGNSATKGNDGHLETHLIGTTDRSNSQEDELAAKQLSFDSSGENSGLAYVQKDEKEELQKGAENNDGKSMKAIGEASGKALVEKNKKIQMHNDGEINEISLPRAVHSSKEESVMSENEEESQRPIDASSVEASRPLSCTPNATESLDKEAEHDDYRELSDVGLVETSEEATITSHANEQMHENLEGNMNFELDIFNEFGGGHVGIDNVDDRKISSTPTKGEINQEPITSDKSSSYQMKESLSDEDLEEFEKLELMFEEEAKNESISTVEERSLLYDDSDASKTSFDEDSLSRTEVDQSESFDYRKGESNQSVISGTNSSLPKSIVKFTTAVMEEDILSYQEKTTRTEIQPDSKDSHKMADFGPPVVIDNGSGYTKAGLAHADYPSVVIPAIIGTPNYEQVMHDASSEEFYVGEDANRYRGVLKLTYPLEHGIVTDWEGMEKLWDHVINKQLRIDPSDHPMLITEAPLNPKKNRERMIEIMMETYQVPAFYIAIQAVLSLYVTGKTTGIVLDSGDGVTHIVPVYDGYSLPHATERMNIAGRDLTEYLMRILMERGYSFTTSAEKEICKSIKESLCFVATDFQETEELYRTSTDSMKSYMLPDGQVISIGDEQFRCPEVLFQPSLIGKDIPGVHEYLYNSIQKCGVDLCSDLYSNIVLSGGTTMLKDLDKRLKTELSILCTNKMADIIKIQAVPERRYSVWCGGAILANLPSFSSMWVSSDEYYDSGSEIVHRKCF